MAESRAAKVFCPVEARGVDGEIGLLPSVVRLVDVVLTRQGDMFFGDGVLQFDDVCGAGVAAAEFASLSIVATCA